MAVASTHPQFHQQLQCRVPESLIHGLVRMSAIGHRKPALRRSDTMQAVWSDHSRQTAQHLFNKAVMIVIIIEYS